MNDKGYDQSIIKPCISYLTNRKQRVIHKVTNTISSKRVSNVGVPLRTRCNRKQWNLFSSTLRIKNKNVQSSGLVGLVAESSVFKTRQFRNLLSSHLRFWASFILLSSKGLIFRLPKNPATPKNILLIKPSRRLPKWAPIGAAKLYDSKYLKNKVENAINCEKLVSSQQHSMKLHDNLMSNL